MRVLKTVLVVLALGTVSAFAQNSAPSLATNEMPAQWFVELTGAPLADVDATFTQQQKTDYRNARKAEKDAWRRAARAEGLQYRELFAYDVLWNGLAIELNPSQLPVLTRLAGTKNIFPVFATARPETTPMNEPELATALAMTGADNAQSELGYTGAGVRVAVMDTGVDFNHPDLGGCFGAGCRVEVGFDLVGDAFNFSDTTASIPVNPTPAPDPIPDDCNGHGTHVAGIVGANGGVKGAAPGVTFGAYRVFGCDGNTSTAIMLQAMERILADGADVLNMSIGSAFEWPQYPTAEASDRLVNKGIIVVASTGNNAVSGLYSAGAPGLGSKVIGVASFDNSHFRLRTFTISPDGSAIAYQPMTGAATPPTSGSSPMARTGTPASAMDACNTNPPAAGNLTGKVALIRRGTCSFREKALNAVAAGAIGVVVYNNAAGRFAGTVGSPDLEIPVVSIANTEGVLINNLLAAGPVTMTWTAIEETFVNPTGGLISGFSSYGLSPDLVVKPDIGAPGGLIRSTFPIEKGSYATISGTSMSSPHVAGGVALLLQAHPKTSAQAVRSILQNSADPKPWFGNPALGFLDNVHRQGAGMLDIDDAILAGARIDPGKLTLGEGEAGPAVRTLKIENITSGAVTFNLSHAPALATGSSTFTPSFFAAFATASFSTTSVTVLAKSTANVDVTITPPSSPVRGQYGGYIVISGGGRTYRVPYSGFIGDYQSIQVLQPLSQGFPWLARLVVPNFVKQPNGATYTMASGDIPYILVHLGHQSRRLRLEVFEAATGKSWHRAFQQNYVPRNAGNGVTPVTVPPTPFFFAFPWNGTTLGGNKTFTVPDGQYVIKLTVLKALGDDSNPAHVETWTSPVITIDRP